VTAESQPDAAGAATFRSKLAITIMVVIAVLTLVGLYLGQKQVTAEARGDLEQDFRAQLQSLHELQNARNRALTERCGLLVAKPRIHAALEDNALDLLYPSAKDELRDLMQPERLGEDGSNSNLHARFCRFLDSQGGVLPAPNPADVGELSPPAEAALSLKTLPESQQIGYLLRSTADGDVIDEIVAAPIFSSETGELISALVVGFKPLELPADPGRAGLTSGIWVNGQLRIPSLGASARTGLAAKINHAIAGANHFEGNFTANVVGVRHLLFYNQVNRGSIYPPAYEVSIYPLTGYERRLKKMLWQIGLTGFVLLVVGFAVSRAIASRLAAPVAHLEATSQQNWAGRQRAEAALVSTSEELERTARYSADASHQLKSPITILRAGLETLLKREGLPEDVYEELSNSLHQTYRLTGVIDDLLLLARMDAGSLKFAAEPVNLRSVIEESVDDVSAMPEGEELHMETTLPPNLHVAGERRYTSLIVQNLLENARKYNRPGGTIRISADKTDGMITMTVGNTGDPISEELQRNLFERFRRGRHHNVSGHGLGLNLARELARLHGGSLRLVQSANDWTEFEVVFRTA
jgi:signal transduction histidine kinase